MFYRASLFKPLSDELSPLHSYIQTENSEITSDEENESEYLKDLWY